MPGRERQSEALATLDLERWRWDTPQLALPPSQTGAEGGGATAVARPPAAAPRARFSHIAALCPGGAEGGPPRMLVFGGWHGRAGHLGADEGGGMLRDVHLLHLGVQAKAEVRKTPQRLPDEGWPLLPEAKRQRRRRHLSGSEWGRALTLSARDPSKGE
eukprot:330192-Pyramimonas_sp.AAC.2